MAAFDEEHSHGYGKQLLIRRRVEGVQDIIHDVDALRIKYGFQSVEVLTPMAETKIRSGYKARISLKLRILHDLVDDVKLSMTLTYPMGYPDVPLEYEADILSRAEQIGNHSKEEFLENICAECDTLLGLDTALQGTESFAGGRRCDRQ
jgi:hypothetical protein